MTRLWGEWTVQFYGSGTTIVCLQKHQHKPHLYIYADAASDESRYMADRFEMCYQLREFMNGGERPQWLDDFDRQSEGYAESLSGAQIQAVGPMVDVDPPNLDWRWDESPQCADDRARVMDVLFLNPTSFSPEIR